MNHADRELLELAAKAAGFGEPKKGAVCWTESEYPRNSGKHGALWNYSGHGDTAELWNPLADDGDTLRLAVKLGLLIDITAYNDRPFKKTTVTDGVVQVHETHNGDPYAATRRAIVRAAAEIAKAGGAV